MDLLGVDDDWNMARKSKTTAKCLANVMGPSSSGHTSVNTVSMKRPAAFTTCSGGPQPEKKKNKKKSQQPGCNDGPKKKRQDMQQGTFPTPMKAVAPSNEVDVNVGTDFSGMDAPLLALSRTGYTYRHVFSSETNASCIKLSRIISPHCELRHRSIDDRRQDETPSVDVYVAGIPCQVWASGGKQEGLDDKDGKGKLWFSSLNYIAKGQPKAAVLECAPTIETQQKFKPMKEYIIKALETAGYDVHHTLVRTEENGVPQARVRFYVVAIKQSSRRRQFSWPLPLGKCVPLDKIITGQKAQTLAKMLPTNDAEKAHVLKALRSAAEAGVDLSKSRIIVDIGCSSDFAQYMVNRFPTITAARSRNLAWWVADIGRRVKLEEIMLLQGFNPKDIPYVAAQVSEQRVAHMVGNAMSCCVLERLLPKVLHTIGISPTNRPESNDRWSELVDKFNR